MRAAPGALSWIYSDLVHHTAQCLVSIAPRTNGLLNLGKTLMDLDSAEKLLDVLASIVDHPLFDDSPKVRLSATLAISSLQFAASVRILCKENLLLGASTTLRSQFEALIRSVWVLHRATENQINRLSTNLNKESQQASKNIPSVNEMLIELEKLPQLKNLLTALNEFKISSWLPLNSFVHAGIHAVHWTKYNPPLQLLENIFRASNGLVFLAFQGIGMLTGKAHVQSELVSAAASFSSILPKHR